MADGMRWAPGEELTSAAERVAGRLRVLGPRLSARADRAAAQDLAAAVAEVLHRLAALEAAATGGPSRPVPLLAPHAWGDQLVVLAADVRATGDDAALGQAVDVLEGLRHRL